MIRAIAIIVIVLFIGSQCKPGRISIDGKVNRTEQVDTTFIGQDTIVKRTYKKEVERVENKSLFLIIGLAVTYFIILIVNK